MSKNILYIDDDESCRNLVKEMLTDEGYSVTTAEGGEDGLVKLEKKRKLFDLVITGLRMPGMHGVEVIKIIRRDLKMEIPIIVLTGWHKEKTYKYLIEEGLLISGWISKPCSSSDLISMVEQVLQIPFGRC